MIFKHDMFILPFLLFLQYDSNTAQTKKKVKVCNLNRTFINITLSRCDASTNTNPIRQMEDMVQTCVSRLIITIEDTFRQYMRDFRESTRNEQTIPPLIQEIPAPNSTGSDSNNLLSNVPTTQSPQNSSVITNLTLVIDERVRSKVHAGEFVKFSSLLPKDFNH